MDQEQINAIKKRLAKTSVGPWIVVEEEFIQNVSGVVGAIHFSKDAHFMAHARKDVPALVAEVESLKADVERHLEDNVFLHNENIRLRKALEFYAEETKYERVELYDGDKEIYIECDGGKIARQALNGEARK